jgi:hypothetical protein
VATVNSDVKESVGQGQEKVEDREKRNYQSTRADNADIPIYLWDMILNPGQGF